MTSDIYPTAPNVPEVEKLDKNVVAAAIIEQLNLRKTKAQAIGLVLNGSDDVATFNEVWNAIEREGKALRSVSLKKSVIDTAAVGEEGDEDYQPATYKEVFKTETEYKADLAAVVTYVDSLVWYAGLKLEKGVSTWTNLKASIYPEV